MKKEVKINEKTKSAKLKSGFTLFTNLYDFNFYSTKFTSTLCGIIPLS
jgi:hypothetical protein